MIFETSTVDAGDGVSVDDILETVHHFQRWITSSTVQKINSQKR